MGNKKIVLYGLANAIGTVIYVSLVSVVMSNGNKWFGPVNNQIFSGAAVLLLLVLSAAVVGTLIFGRPVLWYLDGKKSDAIKLFLYTLSWLFVFTVLALLILANLPKETPINKIMPQ